jgi:hypothetical protein
VWVFCSSVPPQECRDINLNIGHDSPPEHSVRYIKHIYCLVLRCTLYDLCTWHRAENYIRIKQIYSFIFLISAPPFICH